MRPQDLQFGMNGDATVHQGSRSFDLWRQREGGPIQVCEFPVIDNDGECRSITYWINSPERLAEFLSDKHIDPRINGARDDGQAGTGRRAA